MRTILITSLALCFALIPALCHAIFGETLEQCIARYGQPEDISNVKPNKQTITVVDKIAKFRINGFVVSVNFLKGISVCEFVLKDMNDKTDWTDAEESTILHLESDGQQWSVVTDKLYGDVSGKYERWMRTDGARASHIKGSPGFWFMSKSFQDASNAKAIRK